MKTKDVQPFIKTTTKDVIYKMSYINGKSSKQICKDLCLNTLGNKKKLVEELLPFLKWTIKIENNVYSPKVKPIKDYPLSGSLERVAVKIDLNSYDFAKSLAYSLGWTVPKVIAYCVERSMNDFDFLNQYIVEHLQMGNIDENQKVIMNEIMKDINDIINEEQYSFSALLIGVIDELKPSEQNFNEALYELAEKW